MSERALAVVRTIRLGPGGALAENPMGLQITCDIDGRTHLGDVVGWEHPSGGGCRLLVRHFDGSPWPIDPSPETVSVLLYTEEE